MNRRSFLRSIAFTAPALVVAPRVIYAFAPPGGWRVGPSGLAVPTDLTSDIAAYYASYERFVRDFEAQMEAALYITLRKAPTVPYTDAGWRLLREVFENEALKCRYEL